MLYLEGARHMLYSAAALCHVFPAAHGLYVGNQGCWAGAELLACGALAASGRLPPCDGRRGPNSDVHPLRDPSGNMLLLQVHLRPCSG